MARIRKRGISDEACAGLISMAGYFSEEDVKKFYGHSQEAKNVRAAIKWIREYTDYKLAQDIKRHEKRQM